MNYKAQQDTYVEQCNAAIEQYTAPLWQPGSVISKAAQYSLMNGGKRVRGVLVLAVCHMLAGNMAAAEAFACALEMEHAFSLIHDDLPCMDDDGMRRGKPACHIAYGEANALLAGDLLAIGAFEVIAGARADAETRIQASRILAASAGAKGMIYGQELDIKYEQQPADGQALEQIQRYKTGALFDAAVLLGALAAGYPVKQAGPLRTFAANIGLVFQIVDDILDATADEELLGKPVGSDVQQGKSTHVTMYGLQASREKAKQLTQQAVQALENGYGNKAAFLCAFANQLCARIY